MPFIKTKLEIDMKLLITLIMVMLCSQGMYSQIPDIDAVLKNIEQNNTTIIALRKHADAAKMEGRTGIYMPNPEVELNYLWSGAPDESGVLEFNIMQGFDFPTAYSYRRDIADSKALQANTQYEVECRAILLQARKICIDIIHCNALAMEFDKRLRHVQTTVQACREKYEKGDITIVEYNQQLLNLLNIRRETENNAIARTELLGELMRMNGGKSVELNGGEYPAYTLPNDFDSWYKSLESGNLALQVLSQKIEISKQQRKLNSAMNLPKFALGYKSEHTSVGTMQGIGSIISIPLWENRNAVKHAELQILAAQEVENDAKLQYRSMAKILYTKAKSLEALINDYHEILKSINNSDFLDKALNSGHISLIDYTHEISLYYDATTGLLEVERELQYALAELMQWQ